MSVNLQEQHGPELEQADFPIRYSFLKCTGVEWDTSTYDQRKDFLTRWYLDLDADIKKLKIEAKRAFQEQKQKDREKRMQDRLVKLKLAQEARQVRQQEREDEEAKQEFARQIKKREREIKEMRMKDRTDNE